MSFCKFSTEYVLNNKIEIDNVFFSCFMPDAPDVAVKVYLYGLYLCSIENNPQNTIEGIASALNITEDEVLASFMYWQEQGLVQVLSSIPVEVRYIPLKNIFSGSKLFKPEKYEVFNKQAQELFAGVREITKNEYYEYYDFLERYKMEQEALLMIMKYCIDNKKANVGYNYILTVAKNWAGEGILTVSGVEEHLEELEDLNGDIGKVLVALNLKRKAYIEERLMFKKWTSELGFNLDAVLYVANSLKKKSHANFDKLDALLMKYYSLGLFSTTEIENYEKNKLALYDLAKKVNTAIGVYYDNLEMVVENYISKWINLGFSSDAILKIASFARKMSIRTLEGLDDKVLKFFKLGVLSSEALDEYIADVLSINKKIEDILAKIGLNRKVNYLDRQLYKTWKENWKFSDELIEFAATLSAYKAQPMQYLNGILSSWLQNKVTTLEEAKKQSMTLQKPAQKPSFEGRSYKKEELDALLESIDEVEI